MTLHSRLRAGAAAAIAGVVLLTAACSSATPGSPVAATSAGPAPSSAASPPSSSAPVTVTVTATPSPTATGSDDPSSADTTTADEDTAVEDTVLPPSGETFPTGDVPTGAAVDPVTERWAAVMCGQFGTVLVGVLDAPGLDGAAPADFAQAWSDYYATLADTVITATGEMAALDPPAITDGEVVHEGFLAYLKELGLAAGNASIDVLEAPDETSAQVAVQDAQARIAALSEGDYGLAAFEDDELSAVLTQIPECRSLGG